MLNNQFVYNSDSEFSISQQSQSVNHKSLVDNKEIQEVLGAFFYGKVFLLPISNCVPRFQHILLLSSFQIFALKLKAANFVMISYLLLFVHMVTKKQLCLVPTRIRTTNIITNTPLDRKKGFDKKGEPFLIKWYEIGRKRRKKQSKNINFALFSPFLTKP